VPELGGAHPRSAVVRRVLRHRENIWLLVFAAGHSATLGHLTIDREGRAVPIQFCSLNGGQSLLQASLRRARRIASRRRICVVVDRDDERYWRPMLQAFPQGNIIVQPRNCGAAISLLLGVLTILERDPRARIVAWPADHHVLEEKVLLDSVRRGLDLLCRDRESCLGDRLLLLGVVPDEGDAALSYVVPGEPIGVGTRDVAQFVYGPPARAARALLERGALYNSCILAADATSIVECIRERHPQIVAGMASRLALDANQRTDASCLAAFYQNLPTLNWEQVGGKGSETAFCVFTAPACGWSELATPRRLGNALQRIWSSRDREPMVGRRYAPPPLNLATGYTRSVLAPTLEAAWMPLSLPHDRRRPERSPA
jgi:mannose-1-phosphate guanylyltransferase